MTTSSRNTHNRPLENSSSAQPTPQATVNNERIGDILRRVREHRQEGLTSIADYLCIRQAYLYALEESHYDDLPAEAYVIGFLRTYALYLGLDGQGAVEQYRREMAGRPRSPNLSMPQPMPQGRAPTIALLAGAAVAAIILYGLWYGLSTPEEAMKQPVPLPETIKITPPEPVTLQTTQPNETKAEKTTETSESKKENEAVASTLLEDTTSPGIALSVKGTDETALPPEAAKKLGALIITAPEKKKIEDPKKEQEQAQEPAQEAKNFGAKSKARVILEAKEKTWILVTDQKGVTIFDRTLLKGQKYNVRNNRERRLTTGNAKGLNFIIDGKKMPSLKTNKRVVRAIDLSPTSLIDLLN